VRNKRRFGDILRIGRIKSKGHAELTRGVLNRHRRVHPCPITATPSQTEPFVEHTLCPR
jgi:hypothetical protein